MNELIFIAMDIAAEARHLIDLNIESITDGMTENELKAYYLGMLNVFEAIKIVTHTEKENELVLHMSDIEIPTEFDYNDLESYLME